MNEANIINFLAYVICAGLGYWISVIQKDANELAKRINSIEVLVAGNYVKREEFNEAVGRLFIKLDDIDRRLGSRQEEILERVIVIEEAHSNNIKRT